LILCPTRELVTQTAVIAEKVCQNSFPWLVAGYLSGGEKRKSEKARLRKGITILIATPGRLLDHLSKTDSLMMSLKGKLEWVVLDESDRLLDMGLGSQVEQIMQMVRANQPKSGRKRDGVTWQSILVSATFNEKVKNMSTALLGGDTWVWARFNKNDLKGNDGDKAAMGNNSIELSDSTPKQLTQHHMVVSSKLRLTALIAFLTERIQLKERIVIFMSTCDGVDFHHKLFNQMQSIIQLKQGRIDADGIKSDNDGIFGRSCEIYRLHGNIPHRERNEIMSKFSDMNEYKKKSAILITTDVAARGLNLPAVDWIVQYDPPCETNDYIHRAGRAARAGHAGHALLFLLPSETQYVEILKLRGLKKLTPLSLSSTLQTSAKLCPGVTSEGVEKCGGSKSNDSRKGEAFSSGLQQRLEDCLLNDDKLYKEALLKKALPHGDDKVQKRKQRKEAKHAIGPLLECAILAFSSYIRGYSAKEKCVRHIFSARALHLGHVAKSFALQEQPKDLLKTHRNNKRNNIQSSEELKSTGRKRSSQLAFGKEKISTKKKDKSFTPRQEGDDYNDRPKTDAKSIKSSMLAAATRIQESEMEFF
jgi:ATP-dependent RNA helicase DDX31/DBP7